MVSSGVCTVCPSDHLRLPAPAVAAAEAAYAAQVVAREAAVQERVRDGWPDDGLVVDVDLHRDGQWQRDGREADAWRRQQGGREQQLDELLRQDVVGAAVRHVRQQQGHAEGDRERELDLAGPHFASLRMCVGYSDLKLVGLLAWCASDDFSLSSCACD